MLEVVVQRLTYCRLSDCIAGSQVGAVGCHGVGPADLADREGPQLVHAQGPKRHGAVGGAWQPVQQALLQVLRCRLYRAGPLQATSCTAVSIDSR